MTVDQCLGKEKDLIVGATLPLPRMGPIRFCSSGEREYLIESDGLQSLGLHCGCQTSVAPSLPGFTLAAADGSASDLPQPSSAPTGPTCAFCPDDQVSRNLAYETPLGFTCADLVDYFKFLPLPLDCKKDNMFSDSQLNKITDFWVDEDLEWESLYGMCECTEPKRDDPDPDDGVPAGDGGQGTVSLNSAAKMNVAASSSLFYCRFQYSYSCDYKDRECSC